MHNLFDPGDFLDAGRLEEFESLGVVCGYLSDAMAIIRQGKLTISAKHLLKSIRQPMMGKDWPCSSSVRVMDVH